MTLKTLVVASLAITVGCGSSSSHDGGTTGDATLASSDLATHPVDAGPQPGAFYVYEDDTGTGMCGLNALWDNDYSYGQGAMTYACANGNPKAVVDYEDTTHVQAGEKYDLLVPKGVGWQPASTYYGGMNNKGPYGIDISPYTYMVFDLWSAHPTDQFDSKWEYDGDVGSAQADQPAPAYMDNVNTVPGITVKGSEWNVQVKLPLSLFGHLGMHGCYKFFLRDNSNNDMYLDNVGFIAGTYSWIHNGGAANGWNTTSNSWNHDASTLLHGWSDQSASATANYMFSPTALTTLQGPSGLTGLLNPGQTIGTPNVIELSISASGGMWKIKNTSFTLAPYTTLTFGLLPTNTTHTYMVQLYDTAGAAVGSVVDPKAYTNRDWGANGQAWTIYNIPLSAFGTLPANIGALSLKDTSGLATNKIYITAPAFFD